MLSIDNGADGHHVINKIINLLKFVTSLYTEHNIPFKWLMMIKMPYV